MQEFVRTAKRAAMEAGKILRSGFLKQHELTYKKEHHQAIVTAVDLAAEHTMRRIIRASHPDHAILGEELGMTNGGHSPYLWVLDPLDGTTNYVHGMPTCSVAVALQNNGQTMVSVIGHPVTGELFFAVRGGGAWIGGKRARVSGETALTKAYGFIEWTAEDPAINKKGLRIFTAFRNRHTRIRNIGSGVFVFSYVGAGRGDYAISVDSKLWDVTAASLFIHEAGGRVTDFEGNDPTEVWRKDPFATCSLLATNGKIHQKLLRLVS